MHLPLRLPPKYTPKKEKKKSKREGEVAEWIVGPLAKIQMMPPICFVFRIGSFTSAVQQSILWAWGFSGAQICWEKKKDTNPQDSVADPCCDAAHLLMCLWWKTQSAGFVSSRLEWNLPCVANTVGCWHAAQVWDNGREGRLRGRSYMICCFCGTAMSHGLCLSMWLWRMNTLLDAQWQYWSLLWSLLALVGVTRYNMNTICIQIAHTSWMLYILVGGGLSSTLL